MKNNTVNTVVRLPKALHTQLRNEAFHSKRSQHKIMIEAIKKHLETTPKEAANASED